MIKQVRVTNFRAFKAETINLAKVTVLIGPNNAGKSSLLAPLRLLAQTVTSFDYNVPLLLNGPLGDFGGFRDVVHGNHRGTRMELGITVDGNRRLSNQADRIPPVAVAAVFKYNADARLLYVKRSSVYIDDQLAIRVVSDKDGPTVRLSNLWHRSLAKEYASLTDDYVSLYHFLPRLRVYRDPDDEVPDAMKWLNTALGRDRMRVADAASSILFGALRNLDYLGAMRAPPARTYLHTGERREQIAADGSNWPNLLTMDEFAPALQNRVLDWLRQADLASDLQVKWTTDQHYEIQVKHPVTGEVANIADVGQGHSQVLPVVVGALKMLPGSTFLVEEPEIHLHPAAQAALGDLLATLYQGDVQTLVETHSEYLLLRLQQKVASGEIEHDDVAIYYVYPDKGGKRVRRLTMDEFGSLGRNWPGEFFPQRMDESLQLARTRAAKRAKK